MTAPICFVDTETTGLHPDRHEIWEVGLITPDGAEHEWLLPVHHLEDADPFALQIGGFHRRHPRGNACDWGFPGAAFPEKPDVTPFNVFAREFARLTHGLHLAGAVVSFDEERLRRLLLAQGVQPGWHHRLFCVETLAAGRLKSAPPWNSKELSRAVGVDPDDERFQPKHTALADARWAKAVYEAVMA